ncbi:MAG: hypothetical protein Q9228_002294 [Teloschistes exilis]
MRFQNHVGRRSSAAAVVVTLLVSSEAQRCYMPDQTTVATEYTPCNTSAIADQGGTHCCAGGAACLGSGLCYLQWDMSINTGACTDRTWSSTACFHGCPATFATDNVNTLFRCSGNEWCCSKGGNTTSCCDDRNVILFQNPSDSKLAQIYNGSAFASGFTLSQVSRSTTSTASTATPSATATNQVVSPTPNSDDRNENSAPAPAKVSTTTKVGVGVGVGVGVPLLAALGATLFLWSKEKKRGRELQQRAAAGAGQEPPWAKAQEGYKEGYGAGGSQRVHEMPGRLGDDGIKEMDGAERRREMAAHPSMKYNPPG